MASYDADALLVNEHVRAAVAKPGFLCEPAGVLRFPYICPGGFYAQLWDWDSLFAGIGVIPFGGARYLLGSFLNFLDHTDASGCVPGCLTPKGPSSTLAHAKPVIIQGALLGAKALGEFESLRPFLPKMRALLEFWERERRDPASGLYVWFDQMESGADDLPYAEVPSKHTATWSEAAHAKAFSAPDVMVFLEREHTAFAHLLAALSGGAGDAAAQAALEAEAGKHAAKARDIAAITGPSLWHSEGGGDGGEGYWCARSTRTQALITSRTYQMAWPLWSAAVGTPQQRAAALRSLLKPDMRAAFGIRSTSTGHPRFSLEDAIVPYSIWRGPIWINVNIVLCYALAANGAREEALKLARQLVAMLAADLRNPATGAWHECYHPDNGTPLSKESKGFLSWNVMAAMLLDNLERGVDPTAL